MLVLVLVLELALALVLASENANMCANVGNEIKSVKRMKRKKAIDSTGTQ